MTSRFSLSRSINSVQKSEKEGPDKQKGEENIAVIMVNASLQPGEQGHER